MKINENYDSEEDFTDFNTEIKEFKKETEDKAQEIKKDVDQAIKKDKEEIKELEKDIHQKEREEEKRKKEVDNLEQEKEELIVISDKKKEKRENTEKTGSKDNEDDDISIDLTAIKDKFKSLFSKKEKGENTEKTRSKDDEDDDISFDFTKILTFAKTNAKWLIPVACILIAMFASIYLRTMPLNMPITDDWAENTVNNFYRSQISNQINQQYPNLPQENKNALIETEFQKKLEQNKDQVNNDIKQLSLQYKAQFKDNDGNLYLLGIDPWHFYRQVYYLVNNGIPGTTVENNEVIDEYRLAPLGIKPENDFHARFGMILHKSINLFSKVPLMFSFFLIGTIFSALSVIFAFLIGKIITKNNVGGFFTALLIAVSSFFVSRTTGESSDTDVYVVFFPLLVTWLFLEALEAKELKRKMIFGSLAGLATGVFSFAWGGWWYVSNFIFGTIIIYLIYELVINKRKFKEFIKSKSFLEPVYLIFTYLIVSGIFVTFFQSFQTFVSGFDAPLKFLTLKEVGVNSLWPNIYTTVAELNVVPISQVISQLGGNLLFVLAIMGVLLTIINKDERGNRDVKVAILLTIWFLASFYATTKGVRFILQAIPVFAISLGAFLGITWGYASKWIQKEIKLEKVMTQIVVFLILAVLLIQPVKAGYEAAHQSVPSMNDAWYDSLTKIKNEAPEDIIITSWWDFGYWFRAIADRPVTFDGGTQVGYGAYWVGKSLLTNDEKVTKGILRMLNCGQNNAFEELNKIIDNTPKSINLINQIIVLEKNDAIKVLNNNGLNSEQIAKVIKYTHCEAPIDYYITSSDMVSKAGVWGHFGSWDFDKALMYQKTKEMSRSDAVSYLIKDFNLTEEQADQIHYEIQNTGADQWISPWPGYRSGLSACNNEANQTILCNINTQQGSISALIKLSDKNVLIKSNNNDQIHPTSLVYADKEEVKEKKFNGTLLPFSIVLIQAGDSYQAMVTDPLLADSTFTKLFFFNGHGMKCFNQFDERTQFTGGKISVWEVDWNCQQKNQVYFLPKEEVKASHLLITPENKTEEEALGIIEMIRANITKSNFADYAKKYSEGPSATSGGELGWFGKGQMAPEFENVAFSLKIGEISEPVKTQFGYHLILVEDKRLK